MTVMMAGTTSDTKQLGKSTFHIVYTVCMYADHCTVGTLPPTLLGLMAMKGVNEKPLRVIETIAAGNYKKFGMYLLQDENGLAVDLLKRNHIHDGAESVTEAILQKWLTSDAPAHTHQHLIECLRQSELGALAELIANTTVGEGMLMQDFKKHNFHAPSFIRSFNCL